MTYSLQSIHKTEKVNLVVSIDKIIPLSDHHLNKARAGRLLSAKWGEKSHFFPTEESTSGFSYKV